MPVWASHPEQDGCGSHWPALLPLHGALERTRYHDPKTSDTILHKRVMLPNLLGLHGNLYADTPRGNDEGHVKTACIDERHGCQHIEMCQPGEDHDIPR